MLVAEANGDYYNADKVIRQRHSPELMISADFRFKFGDELRSLSLRRGSAQGSASGSGRGSGGGSGSEDFQGSTERPMYP